MTYNEYPVTTPGGGGGEGYNACPYIERSLWLLLTVNRIVHGVQIYIYYVDLDGLGRLTHGTISSSAAVKLIVG